MKGLGGDGHEFNVGYWERKRSNQRREFLLPLEGVYFAVIPAKAGIHWLQVLRDPCLRRDDGKEASFDTRFRGDEG